MVKHDIDMRRSVLHRRIPIGGTSLVIVLFEHVLVVLIVVGNRFGAPGRKAYFAT
jgi:hypothetical protein